MNRRNPILPCTWVLSTLAATLLAACGSHPSAPAPVQGAGGVPTVAKAPSSGERKTVPTKKGGGYYKDDGPGDEVPANLDEIPDAQPRWEPLHKPALKPYSVLGKNYVPQTSLQPYRQRGIASWYGKKFHGEKTSNGELYNMFAMTAAHTTLPIPSYVRVRQVATGKTVIVRVNDRGPFHEGRIIDLSYTAAHKLGLVDNGSGEVEIETILPGSDYASVGSPVTTVTPPPVVAKVADPSIDRDFPPGVYLQLGAFGNRDNADNLRHHLAQEMDWSPQPIRIATIDNLHKLQMGPFATRAEAEGIAQRILKEFGSKPYFVTH